MEPVAVAGLASSIITFLDCSIKLAKLTKQVYDAGGELPKDLKECQSIVDEFSGWIRDLKSKQSGRCHPSNSHDQSLTNAIDHCADDCNELLQIYQDLLPKSSRSTVGVTLDISSSFATVIRAIRKEGRIQKVQRRLEMHKNELRLHIAERTMHMVEQTLETGSTQLAVTRSVETLHIKSREENRMLYGELTRLQLAGQRQNCELGSSLKDMHRIGQEEIVACLVQHNIRFDQLHTSLGMVEHDLEAIKLKGDDTLLLVKQLVNTVNARGEGSAAIYIRIPRALYDPGLSLWKGYRAYVDRASQMRVPGAWIPVSLDHVQDRRLGTFPGRDARATYLTVASSPTGLENLRWERNLVGPGWSLEDFRAAYDKQQSWLSYLLCYGIVGIRAVPVIRQKRNTDDKDNDDDVHKTWTEMLGHGRLIEDTGKDDSDSPTNTEAKGQTKGFSISTIKENTQAPSKGQNSPAEPLIEPQIGIHRRTSGDLDVPAEVAELDAWIKAIEAEHAQQTSELEPFIRINKHLQTISSLPNDNDAIKRNIHKMLVYFKERSSFEMPELVQMMTVEADGEADKTGLFKWGFQLVVARNEVNFQLAIFIIAVALVWVCLFESIGLALFFHL
ncbi:hypothetical protein DL771_005931 [Monosporascus sp. 5C6A]|nr:hypothetical protein DL771_005931 [Monosporascus sp. 5C6A]